MICRQCSASFEVTDQDLAFYDRVSPVIGTKNYSIPAPKLCSPCRQQRRLAWRNELHLYRRPCDLCKRDVVSVHPSNTTYPVYCLTCWWGDRWSPMDFGMDLDHSKPFLKQFQELQARVPQLAIQNDNGIASENSEFCYDISRAKNCYRVIGSWYIEDCYYSVNVNRAKFVVDCNTVSVDSELVYGSLDSQRLYACAYLQNCEGCSQCYFGYDLKGCHDCVCCYGLRQKRFHIFNQPYSESEYRAKFQELNLGSYSSTKRLQTEFDNWALSFPRRAANIQNCEDSIGNNLFNCKSVLGFSVYNSEYSKFIDRSDGPKNCYDIIQTGGAQWCCDCVTPDDSYLVLFSVWCWKSRNILYSDNCHSSENLCGCISMRRNQHCILNKQYSKEEYESNVGTVIEQLTASEQWGEMLPVWLSPFAYNESAANEYYTLTKEQVLERGWRWSDELPETKGKETIPWSAISDNINGVSDTIADQVLACVKCEKNYKITPQELKFYRNMTIPIPRECLLCRHEARFRRKAKTQIWQRSCSKCHSAISTTYSPDSPEQIYCDSCYLAQVY